eukprot:958178-Pelagomonas_calceolata.AAC.1
MRFGPQAVDNLMPGFDKEIQRMAQRLLIQGRPIDYHTGVIATKVTPGVPGVKPVVIELTDMKTKKVVDSLEVSSECLAARKGADAKTLAEGMREEKNRKKHACMVAYGREQQKSTPPSRSQCSLRQEVEEQMPGSEKKEGREEWVPWKVKSGSLYVGHWKAREALLFLGRWNVLFSHLAQVQIVINKLKEERKKGRKKERKCCASQKGCVHEEQLYWQEMLRLPFRWTPMGVLLQRVSSVLSEHFCASPKPEATAALDMLCIYTERCELLVGQQGRRGS